MQKKKCAIFFGAQLNQLRELLAQHGGQLLNVGPDKVYGDRRIAVVEVPDVLKVDGHRIPAGWLDIHSPMCGPITFRNRYHPLEIGAQVARVGGRDVSGWPFCVWVDARYDIPGQLEQRGIIVDVWHWM